MEQRFESQQSMSIDAGPPNMMVAELEVSGLLGIPRAIAVDLDITHSYTGDLSITLFGPSGRGVLLAHGRGAHGHDFKGTVFQDDADWHIERGDPPFDRTFRPEGELSALLGSEVEGLWRLRVADMAWDDGGSLNSWALRFEFDDEADSVAQPAYEIAVDFRGGLSASQRVVFEKAATRWGRVIKSPHRLEIAASGVAIDGPSGVLGQAGPTYVDTSTYFPVEGTMEFDAADLAAMEADGSLFNVILHEMGHVIGIGTLWNHYDLVEGRGTDDPLYTGANAMREYGALLGTGSPTKVPAANRGGAGTADSHWREDTFGPELMSGFADMGPLPLSRLTVAALADLGYEVDYSHADPYALPGANLLAMFRRRHHRHLHVLRPRFEVR